MDRLSDELRSELSRFGVQSGLAAIVEAWPAAVGESIARNAWPARISRDGTVNVATADSVWAFELAHRAAEIAERLGVPKVKFAPGPLPSYEGPSAADAPPSPSPDDERRAAAVAAEIDDEKLREAVQKAVSLSLARGSGDRQF